ncbi:MAG: nuclease [Bellilinea sp.]|nr:MAG: nuclease [Bellilinea sp.]
MNLEKGKILIHFFFINIILVVGTIGCNLNGLDPSFQTEPTIEFNCIPSPQENQTATVISVIDGDTIKIKMNNQNVSVRYIGINAPEFDSDERRLAEEAMQYNAELVNNQTVTLYWDISDTDRFGRLLRYVFVGEIFVNYELVRLGFARQRDYPPDSACKDLFIKAQEEAIAMRRGIWKSH